MDQIMSEYQLNPTETELDEEENNTIANNPINIPLGETIAPNSGSIKEGVEAKSTTNNYDDDHPKLVETTTLKGNNNNNVVVNDIIHNSNTHLPSNALVDLNHIYHTIISPVIAKNNVDSNRVIEVEEGEITLKGNSNNNHADVSSDSSDSDSSSNSDSDSDSDSSSSDSDSSDDDDNEDENIAENDDFEDIDDKKKKKGSKPQELYIERLEPVNITILATHTLVPVGAISHSIDDILIIDSTQTSITLDLSSVLCLEDRTVLGRVEDVFGPVKAPFYSVRFATPIDTEVFHKGKSVFFVPDFVKFVSEAEVYTKGCDASGDNDMELPPEEIEFSDDEKEAQAKLLKKQKKQTEKQQKKQKYSNPENAQPHSNEHQQKPSFRTFPPKPQFKKNPSYQRQAPPPHSQTPQYYQPIHPVAPHVTVSPHLQPPPHNYMPQVMVTIPSHPPPQSYYPHPVPHQYKIFAVPNVQATTHSVPQHHAPPHNYYPHSSQQQQQQPQPQPYTPQQYTSQMQVMPQPQALKQYQMPPQIPYQGQAQPQPQMGAVQNPPSVMYPSPPPNYPPQSQSGYPPTRAQR